MAKTTIEKVDGGAIDLLTKLEVAKMLKISQGTLTLLVQSGQIHALRVGGQWRFERADVRDYVKRVSTKAGGPRVFGRGRPRRAQSKSK